MKRRVARILATIMMAVTFANAFSNAMATADDYVYVEDEDIEAPAEVQEAAEAPVQEEAPAPVEDTPAAPAEELPAEPEEEAPPAAPVEESPAGEIPSIEETVPSEEELPPEEETEVLPEEEEISTEEVNVPEEVTLKAYAGQTKITVTFMSDAFDGTVTLEAEEITKKDRDYEKVEAAVEEAAAQNEDLSTEDFAAFDIRFIDEEGEEVEPAQGAEVYVSISTTGKETPAPKDVAEVIHITNDNQVEFMDADTSGKTADFTTDNFSIYVVIGGAAAEEISMTAGAYVYVEGGQNDTGAIEIGGKYYVPANPELVDVTFKGSARVDVPATATLETYGNYIAVYRKFNNDYVKVKSFKFLKRSDNQQGIWIAATFDGRGDQGYFDNTIGNGDYSSSYVWLVDNDGSRRAPALHYDRVKMEASGVADQTFGRFTVGAANFGNKKETTVKFTPNPAGTGAFVKLGDGLDYEEAYYRVDNGNTVYNEFKKVERFNMTNAPDPEHWSVTAVLEDGTRVNYYQADGEDNSAKFVFLHADPSFGGLTKAQDDWVSVKVYLRYDKQIPNGSGFANGEDNIHAAVAGGKYLPGLGNNRSFFDPVDFKINIGAMLGKGAKIFSQRDANVGSGYEQQYYTFATSNMGTFAGSNDADLPKAADFFHNVIFPNIDAQGQQDILNTFGTVDNASNYIGYVLKWEHKNSGSGDNYWHLDGAPYTFPMYMVQLFEGTPNSTNRDPINGGHDSTIPSFAPETWDKAVAKFNKHFQTKWPGASISWTDNYNGVIVEKDGTSHSFKITPENKAFNDAQHPGRSGVDANGTITYELQTPPDLFWLAKFTVQYDDMPSLKVKKVVTFEDGNTTLAAGNVYQVKIYNGNTVVKFNAVPNATGVYAYAANGALDTLNLEAGKEAVIGGIPAGSYRVEETDKGTTPNNYELEVSYSPANGNITLQNGKSAEVSVNNHYKLSTGSLTIVKKIVDNSGDNIGAQKEYTFVVKNSAGRTVATKTIKGEGSVTIDGLENGTYTVTENRPGYYTTNYTWTHTISPANGTVYVPAGGSATVTVTNTWIKAQDKTKLEGEKKWIDNLTNPNDRPELKVSLYRDGALVKTESFGRGATKWFFNDLDVYDLTNGHKYEYTFKEEKVTGYDTTVNGTTIINTIKQQPTRLDGTKTWIDDKTNASDRPDLVIQLLRDGKPFGEPKNFGAGATVWSFTDLDKFDLTDGHEYRYTYEEISVPGYMTEYDGNDIKNTIFQTPIDISGKKTWVDGNKSKEERPHLIIQLYRNDKLLEEKDFGAGATEYEFKNLDKLDLTTGRPYTYRVEEVKPDGYKKTEVLNATGGKDFTNTIEQGETSIGGTKEWIDDKTNASERPELVVELWRNGTTLVETRSFGKGATSFLFEGLDRYDPEGAPYVYTVKEVNANGYTTEMKENNHIVNTIKQQYVDKRGTKKWIAPENAKLPQLKVELLRNGDVIDTKEFGEGAQNYEFLQLPRFNLRQENGKLLDETKPVGFKFTYTVREVVPEGYELIAQPYNPVTNANDFTNRIKQEYTDLSGTKVWHDPYEENDTENRPELRVALYRNGGLVETKNFGKGAKTWSFTNLPKYDLQTGEEYSYTAKEQVVNGYDTKMEGSVITNTIKQKYVEVSGTKAWIDDKKNASERPSLIVKLLRDGEMVDSKDFGKGATAWFFDDLPLYNLRDENGNLIDETKKEGYEFKYSAEEVPLSGYDRLSEADDPAIVNRIKQEYVTFEGTKVWIDDKKDASERPELVVQLFRDGALFKTGKFGNGATEWHFGVEDKGDKKLDKYNLETGKPYKYEVKEVKAEGYETSMAGTVITNRITQDYTRLFGTKTWNDPYGEDSFKRQQLQVELFRDDESQGITSFGYGATEWSFDNLPVYAEDGHAYAYRAEEVEVPGYTTTMNGTAIENTIVQEYETIEGTKTWVDNKQQEERPELRMELFRDNVSQGITSFGAGGTSYIFENLPLYNLKDENGDLIDPAKAHGHKFTYRVEEVVPEGYTRTQQGNNYTNTIKQDTTFLEGTKTWIDPYGDDNSERVLKIALYRDNDYVKTYEFDNGATSWRIDGLDKFNLQTGAEYTYTFEEVETPGYTTTVEGNDITNTILQKYKRVAGKKKWIAPEDAEKPVITIELYRTIGTETRKVTEQPLTNDSYSFDNLPRFDIPGQEYTIEGKGAEFTYTVKEVLPEGANYTQTAAIENNTNGLDFVNTINQEYTGEEGLKVWNDPYGEDNTKRPPLQIRVIRDGKFELKVYDFGNGATAWAIGTKDATEQTKFDLPLYDIVDAQGNKIDKNARGDGHRFTYEFREVKQEGYTVRVEEDGTIVNTIEGDTTEIGGDKFWVDPYTEAEDRPELKVQLYRTSGEKTEKVGEPRDFGRGAKSYRFEELPKFNTRENGRLVDDRFAEGAEFTYSVEEIVPAGYTKIEVPNASGGKDFTNTINQKYIDKSGKKTWIVPDGSEIPAITINLYRDKQTDADDPYKTVTIEGGKVKSGTYEFKDLPVYDIKDEAGNKIDDKASGDGHEFVYTIEEVVPEGYHQVSAEENNTNGLDFVNEINQKPLEISLTKIWDDLDKDGKAYEKRPAEISFTLSATVGRTKIDLAAMAEKNKVEIKETVTLPTDGEKTDDNTWKYTWTGLDTYDANGQPIEYLVTEIDEAEVTEADGTTHTVTLGDLGYRSVREGSQAEGFTYRNIRTPDENPGKTVNKADSIELDNRDETFTYTITTKIPDRADMTGFTITDTLVDALTFVGTAKNVTVKVGEEDLTGTNAAVISGQTLTVTLPKKYLKGYAETAVTVEFEAKIKENWTDFTEYTTGAYTKPGIPNKAFVRVDFPNRFDEFPTDEPTVTPDEKPLVKKVNGAKHYDLTERNEAVEYTLTTEVPTRKNFEYFTIKDTLESVLEFVSTEEGRAFDASQDVTLLIGGEKQAVPADAVNGQTLQIRIADAAAQGKSVEIRFLARIREDATNLSGYANGSDRAKIPNIATMQVTADGESEEPKDSTEVTITPPDPKPEKKVGENAPELELTGRDQDIPYTITAVIPDRKNLTALRIEDPIEDVLEFKNGTGEPVVTIAGIPQDVDAVVSYGTHEDGRKMLIVNVPAQYLDGTYAGEKIVVKFTAKFKADADLSDYITPDSGRAEVPNKAFFILVPPEGDPVSIPTEEVLTIPPATELDKDVNGEETHANLTGLDELITYTINTVIPERDNVTNFVITDTIKDVLEFADSARQVSVKVAGETVTGAAAINGRTLTVTIPAKYFAKANRKQYAGKPVVISFNTRIREGADLTPYLMQTDEKGNLTDQPTKSFKAEIPNIAEYSFDIGNDHYEDTSDVVTVTPPDPEIDKEAEGVSASTQTEPVLVGRYDDIKYTIRTEVPQAQLKELIITDTLVKALTFAGADGKGDVIVKVAGQTVDGAAAVSGQTLTVTIDGSITNANRGAEVTVEFTAKIKEELSDIDMTPWTEKGHAEIPNGAFYQYRFPDNSTSEPVPSDEIVITPKDPELVKSILRETRKDHRDLDERFEVFTYTLKTELPLRGDMTSFIIEDILEPELQYVATSDDEVVVEIDGARITGITKIDKAKNTLTVNVPAEYLKKEAGHLGAAVTVENIRVQIREKDASGKDVSLARHINAASGKAEVPNIARLFVSTVSGGKAIRRDPSPASSLSANIVIESNVVTVTPPDPKPEKTVNGGTHFDPVRPDMGIPYQITSRVPERQGLEYFVLTDTIEDVLEFVDGSVNATLGGQNVTNLVRISGQTLTLRLDGQYVAKEYQGQPVVISFTAKFRKGADLSKYITVNYAVPNEATQEFKTPDDNPTEKSNVVTTTPPPEIEKEVKGAPQATIANRREEIPYTINTSIPLHGTEDKKVTNFVITDELEPVLEIVNGSVKVTVDGTEVTGVASVQGQTLTVRITDPALLAKKGAKVQITFTAKIKEGADLTKYIVNETTEEVEIPNVASYRYAFDDKEFTGTTEEVVVRMKPELISIPVEKIWEDDNNRDNVRPQSITVRLTSDAPNFAAKTLTLAAANGWKGTFTDLPRYRITGELINYTVTEDAVPEYTTDIRTTKDEHGSLASVVITNTHTPGRTDVSVVKVWAGDAGVARPASITIRLLANGRATGQTLTLNAANGWSGSFTNLYINENGKKIVYTVTEDTVANYTTTITANGTYAYTVTNTYNTPPAPPEDPPANPPEEPEVLGATRVRTTDTPEVLGARRGKTGDEFDAMQHMMYLLFAASACVLIALSDGKKKEEES